MKKKILSIIFVVVMIFANSTVIFATEEDPYIIDPFFEIVDFDLQGMVVGDAMITEQPFLNEEGEEIGEMTITVKKVADAPQFFTLGYQDYWRTDGAYSVNIKVTGKFFPLNSDAKFMSDMTYAVKNGCSSLLLNSASINQNGMAAIPWMSDSTTTDNTTKITASQGSSVSAQRTFGYTYTSEAYTQYAACKVTSGAKLLPSAPGYVRIWLDINDGK